MELIRELDERSPARYRLGLFLCSCGRQTVKETSYVNLGRIKSCGCLREPHGHKKENRESLTHSSWRAMRERCLNPNNKSYSRYGARGIKIHNAWDDFREFLKDMGPRPTSNHIIDRIDPDENYFPENCRWLIRAENSRRRWKNESKTNF